MLATKQAATAAVGATGSVAGATIATSPRSTGETSLEAEELFEQEESEEGLFDEEVAEEETFEDSGHHYRHYNLPEVKVKVLNPLLLSNWRYSPGGHYDVEQWYFGEDSAISNVADFDLSQSTEITKANADSKEISTFFDTYNNGDHHKTRSSLRIQTTKRQFYNRKGTGATTWFWSFKKGNRGFWSVNTAWAKPSNKKELVLTGGFYMVEYDENSKEWNIKFHKEIKEGDQRVLDVLNVNRYFPKPHWYTQAGGFDQLYYGNWGLMDSPEDLDSKCDATNCEGWASKIYNTSGKWEWKGGKGFDQNCDSYFGKKWCDTVYGWNSDHKDVSEMQWWDHMYGESGLKLRSKLTSYRKGAWEMPYMKTWEDKGSLINNRG